MGDIPAPGYRDTSYTFSIENEWEFTEYVFLAYPWSLSRGAPDGQVTEVASEPVGVGRHSAPMIYAMKVRDWDAVRTRPELSGRHVSPSFFTNNPKVLASGLGLRLSPIHRFPERSPIAGVHDVIRVVKLEGRTFGATRQCWSRRNGGCDESMKPRSLSSGCETRPAKA